VRFIPGDYFEVPRWWVESCSVEMERFVGVPSISSKAVQNRHPK
jgi:hypothetical protein